MDSQLFATDGSTGVLPISHLLAIKGNPGIVLTGMTVFIHASFYGFDITV